jgi:serine/threonine protein kinase
MEIKRAVAWHSKEEVIVKIRWKRNSFHHGGEEKAWRASTEMMLNLPPCGSIARIQHVFETPDAYFVVMEKAGGTDLFEHMHRGGALPIEEVRDVLQQLLTGVNELHSRGCIHKDLKLENVMLDRTASAFIGQWSSVPSQEVSPSCIPLPSGGGDAPTAGRSIVKLIDFDTIEEWTPKSAKASEVLGTDQYIAPEAYEGSYSPASDIFAVGVLTYKLLSGSFPFSQAIFDDRPGENWVGSPKMQQIRDRLHQQRIDWGHPVFRANPAAQQILDKMLAMDEARRPSAREALADPWLAIESANSDIHSSPGQSPSTNEPVTAQPDFFGC